MRESLRDVIRRVLSGSILVTGTVVPSAAAAELEPPSIDFLPPSSEVKAATGTDEIVLRERRPRLVLRRAVESMLELVSSHRSHRSHSSHRSHYSSSGGRTTPRTQSRPRPAPVYTPPSNPSVYRNADLGDRILVRGMRGTDVAELMRLLVLHGFLASNNVNTESLFDLNVEVAVKAFQRSQNVEDDGKVGPVTARLLRRTPNGN
jgi:peptidoglycan hydrolase-like protein with peptidoglycan-binding domain